MKHKNVNHENVNHDGEISNLKQRVNHLTDQLAEIEQRHERFTKRITEDMNKIIKVIYNRGGE